ncbi:MAG: lytic transglycosylase domain-containing protein [Deltaproteobacteria bacterium]|nr:lytic transglycosylase domain-containing protein [Deltaproteobacteria bacterium]
MRICKATSWRVIAAAILVALPAVVSAAGVSSQDKSLLDARDAFVSGDGVKLAGYVEKIRGHALESYPAAWRLRLRLEEAAPEELQEFLVRNKGTVLAEQMRRDWLRVLGKKGQWDLFRQEFPSLVRADFEVGGYALQERWRRQDPSVFAEIRSLWKSPRALPSGCAPVVEAMLQSGDITPRELRDRFRLLVQAGLLGEAKRIAERLPAGQAPAGYQIDDAAGAPARFLERSAADPKTAAGRELAIVALIGLARNDPQQASLFWDGRLKEAFPQEDRQRVWAMLATYAARCHLPEAMDWFGKAGDLPLTDEQLAWRARIALRQGNWPDVKSAIERMSPSARHEPTWIYWLGRALCAFGTKDEGRALLSPIAGGYHFYGRLAAEELGIPLEIPPKAAAVTPEELAGVAALDGIGRALALYGLGLRTEAVDEWLWAVQGMNDRALLAAAELARRNEIWDRAINTADRTVAAHDFTLRYPAHHGDVLQKQARVRNLDEPLVFGLVRQESRFIADARSSAGAEGLMQLMPSTARLAAKKIGMKNFHPSHLGRPEVNAALGAFYLRQMLDGFGGNAALAVAAYNAGPIRANRWRDAKPLEGAIYVETIPFSETRQFVKKVMANAVYYDALTGGEQYTLKSRLGTVGSVAAMKNGTEE